MIDVILDTLIDLAKLLPLLFLAYLLMEFLEDRMGEKTEKVIKKAGKLGPLFGSLLGAVPQCGFSAAASGLFSGGVISVGTLMAVFLSTSDEMLPIMISERAEILLVLKILAVKIVIALICGFLIDLIFKKASRSTIAEMCEREGCKCEEKGIFVSALKHTLSVALFIFIVTLALNFLVYFIGEEKLSSIIIAQPVIGSLISAAVGLIPNCASSVIITELYVDGIITSGALISGLLSGSGIGILVLFRTNRNMKQNLAILGGLYAIGAVVGIAMDLLGVAF